MENNSFFIALWKNEQLFLQNKLNQELKRLHLGDFIFRLFGLIVTKNVVQVRVQSLYKYLVLSLFCIIITGFRSRLRTKQLLCMCLSTGISTSNAFSETSTSYFSIIYVSQKLKLRGSLVWKNFFFFFILFSIFKSLNKKKKKVKATFYGILFSFCF